MTKTKNNLGANHGPESSLCATSDALRNNMDTAENSPLLLGSLPLKSAYDEVLVKRVDRLSQNHM